VCRPERPKTLDLYMMSRCPFARRGVESLGEVFENLKKNKATIDLRVHFIGSGTAATGFTSMHGQDEVEDDLRDLCVIQHYPRDLKFLDYMRCRGNDFKEDWKTCTGGKTGIDTGTIDQCASGNEGKQLLEKSFQESAAVSISASPTWVVNDRFVFSGIDAETIKSNVCAHNQLGGCDATLSGLAPSK
jgi:hypothetical protein